MSSVYLKPGNVIQFVSRASARSIQIVVSKEGNELICDSIGGMGPFFPNAYWLVVCGPHGRYFFHNNYNYLAMKNGKIVIIPSTASEKPPAEGEFRVQDVLGSAQAIYVESVHAPGYFISFDDDGVCGDELKSKSKDKFSQLEIQLVSFVMCVTRGNMCSSFRSPTVLAFNQRRMTRPSKHRVKLHRRRTGPQHREAQVPRHRPRRIHHPRTRQPMRLLIPPHHELPADSVFYCTDLKVSFIGFFLAMDVMSCVLCKPKLFLHSIYCQIDSR